ncbi:alkaline phosphatase family protein [Antrihabitans stalactiti]|uniref:alkaline phosphatase family protein n=1 Tax=Antrihabitans stalactiti TaxID=2584121 RepID=UPI0023F7796A|nr:alkaline phosphatase family protein [Antrihabitans stalactiti]
MEGHRDRHRLRRLRRWYDHKAPPLISTSASSEDALSGPRVCGDTATQPAKYQGRCGFGPRLLLLVISPYAKPNFVDHTVTDHVSILRFIEDNWTTGRIGDDSFDDRSGTLDGMFDFAAPTQGGLKLDPRTGNPV